MKRKANWYGLNMLPLYLTMSVEQLDTSKDQLQSLKACIGKAHMLDDNMINRIIKSHTEQNDSTWVFIEQCRRWREENPNKKQLVDIKQIERNVEELVEMNKKVIVLATKLQKGTIDRVMKRSDVELVFDFLAKKTEE